MRLNVAIVPAGQWGTALAMPLARNGHNVRLWFRSSEAAVDFRARRENRRRLPGIVFPENVTGTADLAAAVDGADLVVIATASVGLHSLCARLAAHLGPNTVLLSLVKALFPEQPRLVSQVIEQQLPHRITVLSGPNFATEIARELPAGTVVAGHDPETTRFVQQALMTERLRVWTSQDVVGVQLGGALKNVIAIGAGISDGLGMGHNSRATLVTRGVAEIARLGVGLGAEPRTFAGVSGIGDLMLTCTGDLSRNRQAGLAIARGTSPTEFTAPRGETGTTVEGIPTTKAANDWALALGIEMPITSVIYRILYENVSPEEGLDCLMTRAATAEVWGEEPL